MIAWFANLSIGARSALAPALAVLGMIGVAAASVMVFERLTQDFRSLNEVSFDGFAKATKFERSILQVNAELYAVSSLAANSSEAAQLATRTATVLKRFDALSKDATSVADLAGDSKMLLATLAAYAKSAREMLDMTSVDAGMALLLMGGVQDNFATLEALLGTLVEAADRGRIGTYQSALGSIGTARARPDHGGAAGDGVRGRRRRDDDAGDQPAGRHADRGDDTDCRRRERGRDHRQRTPQRTRRDGARA